MMHLAENVQNGFLHRFCFLTLLSTACCMGLEWVAVTFCPSLRGWLTVWSPMSSRGAVLLFSLFSAMDAGLDM